MRTFIAPLALCVAVLAFAPACGSAGGLGQKVDILADDYSFEPPTLTVEARSYLLTVRNSGSVDHELALYSGVNFFGRTGPIMPGGTASLSVDLRPGVYSYVCQLDGHEQRGQKGTLTVS